MQRREFIAAISATAAAGAAGVGEARSTDADEKLFTAGLSLPIGPAGRCDDARIGGPVVRWDEAIKQWRMWYYCRDTTFPAGLAPAFGSGSLATATSADGFKWTRVDGPLARGAIMVPSAVREDFDSMHLATGDVIRRGDEWLMVYHAGNYETPQGEGLDAEYRFSGYVLRVGLARSRDGVNWTRIRGKASGGAILEVPEGDVYAAFPNFVDTGQRLLLQYTTVDREARWYRTRMAASTDLVNWESLGDLACAQRLSLVEPDEAEHDGADRAERKRRVDKHRSPKLLTDRPLDLWVDLGQYTVQKRCAGALAIPGYSGR